MDFLRRLLTFLIVIVAFLLVGGLFMRAHLVELLRTRALASASMIYSRPSPITPGLEFALLRERLHRLGYQAVAGRPEHPGEFTSAAQQAEIYLRRFATKTRRQDAARLQLRLEGGRVAALSSAEPPWIEPEPLSLLGNSSQRVSTPRHFAEFPEHLKQAVLAIEDERFYLHFGIDPLAVARALSVNVESGRIAQGGSTLTQQLAKNVLLSQERSLIRKIYEAACALLIETAFTKDQIFEFYLNEVFLGQEGSVAIHGFGEAARSFFGKEPQALTIAESATLAGVIKAPTRFSPRRHPARAKARRAVVLDKMRELGFITEAERTEAARLELKTQPAYRSQRLAPYFVDYLRRIVQDRVELPPGHEDEIKIYTGLDRDYQLCAEKAVSAGLVQLENRYPRLRRRRSPLEGALVAVLPSSGELVAWVGGRDYSKTQFDRVSLAQRQPGSSFKPFVYLTALDQNLNSYRVARTTSLLLDEPVTYNVPGSGPWTPTNYDKEYRGEVTVRQALAHSLNIPTVNLAAKVGIGSVKKTAALFGFGDDLPAVPAIALGAGEVTPLGLARAYAALVNGGVMVTFQPFTEVSVSDQTLVTAPLSSEEKRVASEAAVYVLTNILQTAVNEGTGRAVRSLGITRPVAGKTGTSNDTRDAWFAGFTPRLLAVVWVGFDDNAELGLTGAQGAVPIWVDFMKCIDRFEPALDFIAPPGVVFERIDLTTGLLATSSCSPENIVTEVFVQGTEPVTPCTHSGYPTSGMWEKIFGE